MKKQAQDPSMYAHRIVKKNSKGAQQWMPKDTRIQKALTQIEEQVEKDSVFYDIETSIPKTLRMAAKQWIVSSRVNPKKEDKIFIVRAAAILVRLISEMV